MRRKETADCADLGRFGAGYRRQDCQCVLGIAKDTVQARSDKPSTAKDTKRRRRGGPCVRTRRTSGPGAWRDMTGFARHALVFGESSGVSPAGLIFHERPSVTLSPRRGAPFSVAVEGLRLRRCTLRSLFSGARQRPLSYRSYRVAFQSANQRGGNAVPSVSSPPRAVIRALTSVAPPCLQTSKLPISGAR